MNYFGWKTALITVGAMTFGGAVWAQDQKSDAPAGMPQMGPPAEMKVCDALVGTWDCVMKVHMTPADTAWTETNATAVYKYILGGAVLEQNFEQTMMGLSFVGSSWQTYDRETKQWQMSWADNMTARISLYSGTFDAHGGVFSGEDRMMGQTMINRISVLNMTVDSYDWKGEYSLDGGKTWTVWATAKYTKRK